MQNSKPENIALEEVRLIDIEQDIGTPSFNINEAKLSLARSILLCLFLLVIFMISFRISPHYIHDGDAKELFNTLLQSIIPMSSLIIGYYFGSNEK